MNEKKIYKRNPFYNRVNRHPIDRADTCSAKNLPQLTISKANKIAFFLERCITLIFQPLRKCIIKPSN